MRKSIILYVDTKLSNIHSFITWFSKEHIVFTATHEGLALQLLDQHTFDFIVSDHRLFRVLGHDFLTLARTKQRLSKTILLESPFETAMISPNANTTEIDHFVAKPYHPMQLEQLFNRTKLTNYYEI